MVNASYQHALIFFSVLSLISYSSQLQSSQSWSLFRLQRLLNYPPVLSSWNKHTDFCNGDPSPSLTVVCYGESITQLHINGNVSTVPLPSNFSIDSFFTTLVRLPDITVLSLTSLGIWGNLPAKVSRLRQLEILNISSNFMNGTLPEKISNLKSLQTLIVDDNKFTGHVPGWFGELPVLSVLSLRSNLLIGALPDELRGMETLRVLALAGNRLSGEVPDFGRLTNLQVLDLGGNYLGPGFPRLGKKVVTLVLRKNRFSGGLPDELSSYSQLQELDISSNRFVGPFPPALLSLASIRRIDISANRFTGLLFRNMSCNAGLEFANLSSNLFTGSLPECLNGTPNGKVVLYSGNCLDAADPSQHPSLFCENQAFAVGIMPHEKRKGLIGNPIVVASVVVGLVGVALFVGFLAAFALRRVNLKRATEKPPRRLVEHASTGYPAKMLADARYISQAMKLASLGVPCYRAFSLEEIEAATNNFESSSFIGEGPHGQLYRGKLNDGSLVLIRCLKLKKSHTTQSFSRYIELISKLRHGHLVSAIGHCFEYYLEDSTVSRLILIFEYVMNGTLRSKISEGDASNKLTWTQRITAAIGVAKGIQFLHAGIVPGLFANDLKITNVLLDQNFVAKIGSYNLPVLEKMKTELVGGGSSIGSKENERAKYGDKVDIYDFGVILLEIVSGTPITSPGDVKTLRTQMQATITTDGASRWSNVDQVLRKTCSSESLKTVIEICIRCLSKEPSDRPSIEDVLWNLQFAAQVQDAWRGDSLSSEGSSFQPSPNTASETETRMMQLHNVQL